MTAVYHGFDLFYLFGGAERSTRTPVVLKLVNDWWDWCIAFVVHGDPNGTPGRAV